MVIDCLWLCDVSVICRVVNPRRTSQKIWGGFYCTECTGQRNDFELIPTVEIKTRNPGVFLLVHFQQFVIIAELWRPEVARHWSTSCIQISWNFTDGKYVKSCVAYLTKNSLGSPAVATGQIVPKISEGQSPTMYLECSRFHPNRFTFGEVIAERVNTAERGVK